MKKKLSDIINKIKTPFGILIGILFYKWVRDIHVDDAINNIWSVLFYLSLSVSQGMLSIKLLEEIQKEFLNTHE